MRVKDIIVDALQLVGREDVAAVLKADKTPEGEGAEAVETLVYCFNAVEDELARFYFPLKTKQTLSSYTSKYPFATFSYRPVRILSVQSGGGDADYELFPGYIKTSATQITVEYEYSPPAKKLTDESSYDGYAVGERLVAYGAASEYCLINGEVQSANFFESRYRDEIDKARQKSVSGRHMPPRRWV